MNISIDGNCHSLPGLTGEGNISHFLNVFFGIK